MAITVFSDPHLGRTMQSHTTAASRERLAAAIFQTAFKAAVLAADGPAVCAGDLFDKFQNNEAIIQQGIMLANHCSHIMAGNHDITADVNKVGSLQLLAELQGVHGCDILLSTFGKSECYLRRIGGMDFVFVPHHTTDGLFQQSLEDAREWVSTRPATQQIERKAYLVLHCNYDSGHAVNETSLELSSKQAKWLLDGGFDFILIGHDHHPREDFGGRVIILGNTHPTGFGDITHKRVLIIHDDGRHEFKTVWSPEGRHVVLDVEDLVNDKARLPVETVEFIDVVGAISPDRVLDLARAIRHLWSLEPLAVRNSVLIERVAGGDAVSHDFASIDKVVLDDLKDEPELRELFESYWCRTAADLMEE